MSEIKHYTIVTTRGLEKIQAAYHINQTVNLTHMGFGGINEYVAPTPAATIVSNQWAKIPLERHPKDGFIGGGATIENIGEYRGKWISNVGIYDEDDELILIASTPLVEVSPDDSVVSSYPIDIHTILDNSSSVTITTDTSIAYATHKELNDAIESVKSDIPISANQVEVNNGNISTKWVSPQTLKPFISVLKSVSDSVKLKWTYVQASLTEYGATKLSSSISSDSETESATPKAVKLLNNKLDKLTSNALASASTIETIFINQDFGIGEPGLSPMFTKELFRVKGSEDDKDRYLSLSEYRFVLRLMKNNKLDRKYQATVRIDIFSDRELTNNIATGTYSAFGSKVVNDLNDDESKRVFIDELMLIPAGVTPYITGTISVTIVDQSTDGITRIRLLSGTGTFSDVPAILYYKSNELVRF